VGVQLAATPVPEAISVPPLPGEIPLRISQSAPAIEVRLLVLFEKTAVISQPGAGTMKLS
jgi:hypothetical protein